MEISSNYYNYSSSFFTTIGQSSKNKTSSNVIGDYYSIHNGSYKKLLKAYYAKQDAEKVTSTDATSKKEYAAVKQDADELSSAANTLQNNNKDTIENDVLQYVKAYNSVLDSASETDNTNILRKASWMTSITSANKNLLSDIGITIGTNNKLSLDESKLKVADINDISTLFEGNSSYMNKIFTKSRDISTEALISIQNNKTYGVNGRYGLGYASGILYDNKI